MTDVKDHEQFVVDIPEVQPTVTRYANGQRIPEPETMAAIVRETAGAVTANDFYEQATA